MVVTTYYDSEERARKCLLSTENSDARVTDINKNQKQDTEIDNQITKYFKDRQINCQKYLLFETFVTD